MSTSADSSGSGSVTLTFTPETNQDFAQMNVQNKLSEVQALLPSVVQTNGIVVYKARSNFLMVVFLDSATTSAEDLKDYAQRNIVPELQRIDGVGNVRLFGSQRAMRIWVDPAKLKSYIFCRCEQCYSSAKRAIVSGCIRWDTSQHRTANLSYDCCRRSNENS